MSHDLTVAGLSFSMYDGSMNATETPAPTEPKQTQKELKATARFDALDEAEMLIEESFDEAVYRLPSEGLTRDEILDFLRVELGLRHPQGAHKPNPGLEAMIQKMA